LESYIVRIYRSNVTTVGQLLGVIEILRNDLQITFRTFDELKGILTDGFNNDAELQAGDFKNFDRNKNETNICLTVE
jgi:hypothetical protein